MVSLVEAYASKFFNDTMRTIQEGMLTPQLQQQLSFFIDDTCEFLPMHTEPYEFEGLFLSRIPLAKIKGIVSGRDKTLALEAGKLVGLPVYNQEGKLIWPL